MKKLSLIKNVIMIMFYLLITLSLQAQKKIVLGQFKLGVDTYETTLSSLKNYISIVSTDTYHYVHDNVKEDYVLTDMYLPYFKYYNKEGYLELFFGNNILYAIRFTENKFSDESNDNNINSYKKTHNEHFYYELHLWKKYKQFWD